MVRQAQKPRDPGYTLRRHHLFIGHDQPLVRRNRLLQTAINRGIVAAIGHIRRIARQDIPDFIGQAAQRLTALQALPAQPPGMVAVAAHQQDSFWAQLDAASALKVEIVWRGGQLFIAESTRCGTVPV